MIGSTSISVNEPGSMNVEDFSCVINNFSNKQKEQLLNMKKGQNVTVYGICKNKGYHGEYSMSVDQIVIE